MAKREAPSFSGHTPSMSTASPADERRFDCPTDGRAGKRPLHGVGQFHIAVESAKSRMAAFVVSLRSRDATLSTCCKSRCSRVSPNRGIRVFAPAELVALKAMAVAGRTGHEKPFPTDRSPPSAPYVPRAARRGWPGATAAEYSWGQWRCTPGMARSRASTARKRR